MGRIYRKILDKIFSLINGEPVYTYGDTLSENFQKGRLISVRYPMGSEEYTYGNMGEVVKTVKSIVIDEQIDKIHSYTSEFEYDSWNRIQKMTYPDGEVVDYEYYANGELKAITGEKDGITYPYLVETGYNANGQTAYRILGNGSEQRYFYDKKDRLQTSTLHIGSERISVNTYNYDKVDNITSIHDNGIYFQNYSYDELNRLISANGYDFGAIGDTPNSYSMTMEYNKMSSPVLFNQSITTDKGTIFKNNTYLYNQDSQPNAAIQIGDMYYSYDAAGNPTSILDASGIGRDMVWDAENRLKEIVDTKEGLFHSYAYDHTGERILKRYGTAQSGYVNGKNVETLYDFGESYSAYASAYFVENNNGYTKHYYAGATRLVSKIGEDYYENNELVPTGKEEKKQYFYFQDHLGSSTYITDINGEIAQYSAYTPYGEMFREYRNVTPYRFNGKELDTETGLYYYGARYYNPSTALWLGVDPLASKYPGVSPYVYCMSNPVKYVDPDGRWVTILKYNAEAGGGLGFALSGKLERGTAYDKYGITSYSLGTLNHFNNQNIKESSRNPQMFIGLYAGANVGIEVDWNSQNFEEYTKTFSTSIPIGPASISIGEDNIGINIGFGVGIAFETSPADIIYSLSLSHDEYNSLSPTSWIVTYNKKEDYILDDSETYVIGYKGTALIKTKEGRSIKIPVQCGITDIKTGEPTYLWETDLYRQNKLNE